MVVARIHGVVSSFIIVALLLDEWTIVLYLLESDWFRYMHAVPLIARHVMSRQSSDDLLPSLHLTP